MPSVIAYAALYNTMSAMTLIRLTFSQHRFRFIIQRVQVHKLASKLQENNFIRV